MRTTKESTDGTLERRTVRPSKETATRRMSKDLRKSREQRQRILEAASDVLADHSPGTITLEQIASRVGATKGMIYYYFRSRGELLYHLHMYAADIVEGAVYPILDDRTIPPRERLGSSPTGPVKLLALRFRQRYVPLFVLTPAFRGRPGCVASDILREAGLATAPGVSGQNLSSSLFATAGWPASGTRSTT